MYVRGYLILLILGCTACGLAVFFTETYFFHFEEQAATRANNSALTLRDLERLESGFSQWMLLSDLVLGSDESYLADGTIRLTNELVEAVKRIRNSSDDAAGCTNRIETFLIRQRSRLESTQTLTTDQRTGRLQQLLQEMDIEFPDCMNAIEELRLEMESTQTRRVSEYESLISWRRLRTSGLVLGFLLLAVSLWLWISRMLSKPLFKLTEESNEAKKNEHCKIELVRDGPIEIQQLSQSISELVSDLQEQIRELHRSRAERARLNSELIETSRKAGMAEVASEVLHNVGNVLNSINVSASMIAKQFHDSTLNKLMKVNEIVTENAHDFSEFAKNDERGKHLPKALNLLTHHLASEHESQVEELKLLQDSIEHVRIVIQSQQAFARGTSVIEPIHIIDIIEEAIRINQTSISAAKIKIDLNVPAQVQVESDRHKLLQILINLVSNAVDATVAGSTHAPGLIKIQMLADEENFCIQIVDNGIGIPHDKLETIFAHGFTTKKTGHGFGLHSSAIAAKVLGGSLHAESQGAGTGATFKLTLPIKAETSAKPNLFPRTETAPQTGFYTDNTSTINF